jgi:hypothetical protein
MLGNFQPMRKKLRDFQSMKEKAWKFPAYEKEAERLQM